MPPAPFAPAAMEAEYLADYCRRFASQRGAVVWLGAISWISFLGWDLIHAGTNPLVRSVLPELVVLRLAGLLMLVGVALATLSPRFASSERWATGLLVGGNIALYIVSYVMMVLVPLDYAQRFYFYGLMLSMVFAFGVLRLRAISILGLMALYGVGGTLALYLEVRLSGEAGAAQYLIGAWKLSAMMVSVGIVGVAFGNQLERTQRANFKREHDLARSNEAALAHSREVEVLNESIRRSSQLAEDKANALITLKEHMREEAERRNREKSQFLASAVHDLKQPLQAIGNALDPARRCAQKGDLDGAEAMVGLAQTAARLMREQLGAILEISRLESGYASPELGSFDLRHLVAEVLTQFNDEAHRLGVHLQADFASDAPVLVHSDRQFMVRVLQNLVGNGIKYRDPAKALHRRVTVRVRNLSSCVRIQVEDNGVGIAARHLENGAIFRPFYQVSPPESRAEKGVGLGLSIVSAMLSLLPDHALQLQSMPGVGTRFQVDLPFGGADGHATEASALRPADAMATKIHGLYVLLVEDDPLVRESTAALLMAHGALYEAVASLAELERVLPSLERIPDVVLTDHRLPAGGTAREVIEMASQLHPELPCIVFTGETIAAHDFRFRNVRAVLRKPLAPDDLLAALSAAVSRASGPAAAPVSRAATPQ